MYNSLQPHGLPWVWFLGWKDPLGREWCSVTQMCPTLRPHGLQLTKLPYPSPSPGACSHSCPLNQWCYPAILSTVVPFSCLQSFLASGSFLMCQLFTSGGHGIGASAPGSVLPVNIQVLFPLGLTGWISLQSKGLSRVIPTLQLDSSNYLVLSLLYDPTLTSRYDYCKNHSFDYTKFCWQNNVSAF